MIICYTFKDERGAVRVDFGVDSNDLHVILPQDRPSDIGAVFSSTIGEWVLLEKGDRISIERNSTHPEGKPGAFDRMCLCETSQAELDDRIKKAKGRFWKLWSQGISSITGFPVAELYKPVGATTSWTDD